MQFTFWGVRGSIPVPGPQTARYGGNTTCIEVRGDNGELIILDGGTGIHPLSRQLRQQQPLTAHLLISHTHWDHIHGLPFFTPLFIPGNQIDIHVPLDPAHPQEPRHILTRQLEYSYFPVQEAELGATLHYHQHQHGEQFQIGSATIDCCLTGHPIYNLAYRIRCGNRTLVFTGDHEWPQPGTSPQLRADLIDFCRGVDALIIDSTYTLEEYAKRHGWGHGTLDSSLTAAAEAEVNRLYLTHHAPERSDDELERVYAQALQRHQHQINPARCFLAREGDTVTL